MPNGWLMTGMIEYPAPRARVGCTVTTPVVGCVTQSCVPCCPRASPKGASSSATLPSKRLRIVSTTSIRFEPLAATYSRPLSGESARPRGALPTPIVAIACSACGSMIVTELDPALPTYTRSAVDAIATPSGASPTVIVRTTCFVPVSMTDT